MIIYILFGLLALSFIGLFVLIFIVCNSLPDTPMNIDWNKKINIDWNMKI
jgi:hypothetical protein